MNSKDLEDVKSMLTFSKEAAEKDAVLYDPVVQVQDALASFLQSRLRKLEEDREFEDQIKRMISAKLPEATFAELLRLLDVYQTNNNVGVEKVLSPFIPRAGERVPLLDEKKKQETADISGMSKEMSQDLIQAFQELSTLVTKLKSTPAEDIKKALE